jgi:hypothetical protein
MTDKKTLSPVVKRLREAASQMMAVGKMGLTHKLLPVQSRRDTG